MRLRSAILLIVGVALLAAGGWASWQASTQFQPESIPTEILSSSPSLTTSIQVVTGTSTTTTLPQTTTTASTTTTSTTVSVAYGRPTHLTIEKIGVNDDLVATPLDADGAFAAERFTVAWYNGSVWPGQPGPMLIAAHVAWKQYGADRFARLSELRPDDEFTLDNELGETFRYVVTDIYQVNKESEYSQFINDVVYGNQTNHVLWLNTCGGDLLPTGHFADNIFVRAVISSEEG